MARLNKKQILAIDELTNLTLKAQLEFRVGFRTADYLHENANRNWRELREQLHNGYPVKGVGIKATHSNLKVLDAEDNGFLHLNEDLDPDDASGELPNFPYAAASAAYSFTLLEGYGNALVEIVNPGYLKARQAWHHAVYGDMDLKTSAQVKKAKEGFAKPFKRDHSKAKKYVVKRLIYLKRIRNAFMHHAETCVDFQDFHDSVLGIIASLYFLVLPAKKSLSLYPYQDYDGKWS